jgi:hypothetical protein
MNIIDKKECNLFIWPIPEEDETEGMQPKVYYSSVNRIVNEFRDIFLINCIQNDISSCLNKYLPKERQQDIGDIINEISFLKPPVKLKT